MNNVLIAFIFAAGAAAFVYSKFGRRIGYGNQQSVWGVVAITFVVVLAAMLILLSTVVSL